MLLQWLPTTGAAGTHRPRGTVHVRHQAIHRPASKGRRHSCPLQAKRKRSARQRHKHRRCRVHKRTLHHAVHKAPPTNRRNPATASRDCPGANLTPRPGNIEVVVLATLCLVNDERARFGEQALSEDAHLANAATGHSRDMDARDYFEHVSPGGQTLLMRVRASGFIPGGRAGYALGENIAWGTLWLGTPRSIVKAWMASPGHRSNILDRSYRYTGIGIDTALPHSMSGGQVGGMYTQDFGTIVSH